MKHTVDLLKFGVMSLNVRGIREKKKRHKIFRWFLDHGGESGICFIQEAHCDKSIMNTWKHEWRGHSYYSHGSNDRRGVITLIGAKLEFHLLEIL